MAGIAVVFVMALTSAFLVLVMILIWKTNIFLVILYIVVIGSVELLYLSSVLYKFDQGGYLPLIFTTALMFIMYIWNDVFRRKYHYELEHKISPEMVKEIAADNLLRMPGLAVFYSELVHGIPPIFKHYMSNIPALHSVLVFVSIKALPISKVPMEERFLFRRVPPRELHVFRCVVRYGYTDVQNEKEPFEKILLERLKEFTREESDFRLIGNSGPEAGGGDEDVKQPVEEDKLKEAAEEEIELLDKAFHAGVVHLVGESDVVVGKNASLAKKILIDYLYNFLKRNLRQTDKVFDIPHERMLKVGMDIML